MPSYPSDSPERAVDHIYVSNELTVVGEAMPVPIMGSDHLPVMARLSL